MAQINGKYVRESNENFEEYILSPGKRLRVSSNGSGPQVTPEMAKKYASSKSSYEITVNGNQCTIVTGSGRTETFTFEQTFKDDLFPGQEIQSATVLSGDNKIEVKSVGKSGMSGNRTYEFTPSGSTITYTSGNATAKRTYKRV